MQQVPLSPGAPTVRDTAKAKVMTVQTASNNTGSTGGNLAVTNVNTSNTNTPRRSTNTIATAGTPASAIGGSSVADDIIGGRGADEQPTTPDTSTPEVPTPTIDIPVLPPVEVPPVIVDPPVIDLPDVNLNLSLPLLENGLTVQSNLSL